MLSLYLQQQHAGRWSIPCKPCNMHLSPIVLHFVKFPLFHSPPGRLLALITSFLFSPPLHMLCLAHNYYPLKGPDDERQPVFKKEKKKEDVTCRENVLESRFFYFFIFLLLLLFQCVCSPSLLDPCASLQRCDQRCVGVFPLKCLPSSHFTCVRITRKTFKHTSVETQNQHVRETRVYNWPS